MVDLSIEIVDLPMKKWCFSWNLGDCAIFQIGQRLGGIFDGWDAADRDWPAFRAPGLVDVFIFCCQSSPPLQSLPSGNLLHSYGKSPFLMGKSSINGHFP